MAGPGKAHGRPRAAVFVLACTNWTFVGTEAALEQHERDGSVAPHMPEMEAEVAAVTRHRSITRLEAAKPTTAPSRRALLPGRAFAPALHLACTNSKTYHRYTLDVPSGKKRTTNMVHVHGHSD